MRKQIHVIAGTNKVRSHDQRAFIAFEDLQRLMLVEKCVRPLIFRAFLVLEEVQRHVGVRESPIQRLMEGTGLPLDLDELLTRIRGSANAGLSWVTQGSARPPAKFDVLHLSNAGWDRGPVYPERSGNRDLSKKQDRLVHSFDEGNAALENVLRCRRRFATHATQFRTPG